MKTTNLILKAMENCQTNIAILHSVFTDLVIKLGDEEYDKISDRMAEHELHRPGVAFDDMKKQLEEQYNHLEQLLLTIEKPF